MMTFDEQVDVAFQHHRAGRWEAALHAYRQLLTIVPNDPELQYNLATVLHAQGQIEEAQRIYERVLELKPDFAEAHNNLGNYLKDRGQIEEAYRRYQLAVQYQPNFAEAHNNLASTYQALNQRDAAVTSYRRAIELRPDFSEAYFNLGLLFDQMNNLDGAGQAFQKVIQLRPDFLDAYNGLGNVLQRQGRLAAAIQVYQHALMIDPRAAATHNNMASALKEQRSYPLAEASYRRAIELKPEYAEAYSNLAGLYAIQGRLAEAIAGYRKAVELKPDFDQAASVLIGQLQSVCDWNGLEELADKLIETVTRDDREHGISPFIFFGLPIATTHEQQWKCARNWARALSLKQPPAHAGTNRFDSKRDSGKIKIGYLSGDFHGHATTWLIVEMIEKHDRARFEVHAYSYGPDDGSPTRQRIVQAFDFFHEIGDVSFPESARKIASDGIDIVIDLKGYTTFSRAEILAYRPAPIQINYLGYPGTMGADFIDYILVDRFIVPESEQAFYSERLIHLPRCYQPNDSQVVIHPNTPTRSECGLPEQGFVFCSFNNSYKITSDIFSIWLRLLQAVPDSVLWLLEANPFAKSNLIREAEKRGVPGSRLVFAPKLPLPMHLARHRLADLFLDTYPVSAHTTASDALRMGLPVLTLSGQTFASRVAGSLLHELQLSELITCDFDQYETLALRLATDHKFFVQLRTRLDTNLQQTRLFEGADCARAVESALEEIWKTGRDIGPILP